MENEKRVGLVLAGGGARGAYQIGVWKALREFGIDDNITDLAGASVGALNAALFANGDFYTAEDVWANISKDQVFTLNTEADLDDIPLPRALAAGFFGEIKTLLNIKWGPFSQKGLTELMEDNINFNRVRNFGSVYVSCTRRPQNKAAAFAMWAGHRQAEDIANLIEYETEGARYFDITRRDDEEMRDCLLASSALPFIYSDIVIDGEYYMDGGLKDNVPVKPLYDEGIRKFIVVYLSTRDIKGLVDKEMFPDARFFEIYPSKDLGDIRELAKFNPENSQKLMKMGYVDTIKILKPLYELHLAAVSYNEAIARLRVSSDSFAKEYAKQTLELEELWDRIDENIERLGKRHRGINLSNM